jgi:hypothetical protein
MTVRKKMAEVKSSVRYVCGWVDILTVKNGKWYTHLKGRAIDTKLFSSSEKIDIPPIAMKVWKSKSSCSVT